MIQTRSTLGLLATWALLGGPSAAAPEPDGAPPLAERILADADLAHVLEASRELLRTGLGAGSEYRQVWIRDLNTFIELGLQVGDRKTIADALTAFFAFQGPEGDIPDAYVPTQDAGTRHAYRSSGLAPGLLAHKNTAETDQESSLIQAVAKYVRITGDRPFLDVEVGGVRVRDRLARAIEYLLGERRDPRTGLLWGGTTVDWGDVQPEHAWGVLLNEDSHRAVDVYDNAMFVIALRDYASLVGPGAPDLDRITRLREAVERRIREHLWDAARRKFVPHLYLDGSPFPEEFDESAVYYHGGTAVAIEAGLLRRDEILASLEQMRANVRQSGAGSIGLTVHPPYPVGAFANPRMAPYSYQNGGDWCWFGGRMIQQLVRHGFVEEAYRELAPMVRRVRRHGGFYEWWTRDGEPRGSGRYRGSAGVLGRAIEMLRDWARANVPRTSAERPRAGSPLAPVAHPRHPSASFVTPSHARADAPPARS